jgi:hypothetical protein
VVGVPFYQPEQWGRLKEIVADPDTVEESHGAWLTRFRKCEADMKRIGVLVKSVYVDVDDLASHCEQRGVSCTREYRAQYAAELFRQAQIRAREEEEYDD